MWDNLIVYHAKGECEIPDVATVPSLSSLYQWKTCQRCVFIGDSRLLQKPQPLVGFDSFFGYEAYAFLLEVITGLRSSLFAETEVLHQFKTHFDFKNLPEVPFGEYLLKLRNNLLEDARFIRRNHLMNLGDQSYGGIVHRLLPENSRVLILGSGQLAQKIIGFVKKGDREVVIAARNQKRREELALASNIQSLSLEDISGYDVSHLVIAAPVPVDSLQLHFSTSSIIVDLRDDDQQDSLGIHENYKSFAGILKTLDQTKDRHQILYKKLHHVIEKLILSRRMARFEFVNGWEDIPCLAG